MNKLLFLFLCVFCLCQKARPQDTVYRSAGMNLGMGYLQRQDLILSPVIHRKWSPLNTTIQFNRSGKWEQQAHLRFGSFKAISAEPFTFTSPFTGDEITSYPHSFLLADLNYSLGRIYRSRDHWRIFLGGSSNNRLNLSSYNFGLYGSTIYYFAFSLDLWAKADYRPSEKHVLSACAWLPVISWVSRSPYLSVDDQYLLDNYTHKGLRAFFNYIKRGEVQSWFTIQMFDLNLSYRYAINDQWGLGVSYWFSINMNNQTENFSSVEDLLYVTGIYKF